MRTPRQHLRPHGFGWPFSPLGALKQIMHAAAKEAVGLWFSASFRWVARIDLSAVHLLWHAINATTRPVIGGPAWTAEFRTMSVIAATVALPLLVASAILAIARQDPSGLVRTAFVRVPLALIFTGAAVELVSLSLAATDQASQAIMHSAGSPLTGLFTSFGNTLRAPDATVVASSTLMVLFVGVLSFLVWLELAVRSAAVAVAVLWLPLALAGSAFPGTAHWARRLAETLAALVLSKLVIVSVLAMSVAVLGTPGSGPSAVVEGVVLLALTVVAPFALVKILPMVESGAVAHLDGLGRQSARQVSSMAASPHSWMGSANGSNEGAGGASQGSAPGEARGSAGLDTAGISFGRQGSAADTSGATPPAPPGPVIAAGPGPTGTAAGAVAGV